MTIRDSELRALLLELLDWAEWYDVDATNNDETIRAKYRARIDALVPEGKEVVELIVLDGTVRSVTINDKYDDEEAAARQAAADSIAANAAPNDPRRRFMQ